MKNSPKGGTPFVIVYHPYAYFVKLDLVGGRAPQIHRMSVAGDTGAPTPFQLAAPVPALLWDTFEEAMKTGIKRLVKDIAGSLGQPEAPLLTAILRDQKTMIRPYLFDETGSAAEKEVDMRCEYITQRPDAPLFLQPCCQPVVWTGAETHRRCAQHMYAKALRAFPKLPVLTPLEWSDDDAVRLFRDEDGVVYDVEFQPRGTYEKATQRLTLFELPAPPAAGDEN